MNCCEQPGLIQSFLALVDRSLCQDIAGLEGQRAQDDVRLGPVIPSDLDALDREAIAGHAEEGGRKEPKR